MSRRRHVFAGTLAAVLTFAGPTAAARYVGDVTDARTGAGSTAKVKTTTVGSGVQATIRCKPRRGCPLARRTRIVLASTGDGTLHEGTFTLRGSRCEMQAYIYPAGFQATYSCGDGSIGSVGGFSGRGS